MLIGTVALPAVATEGDPLPSPSGSRRSRRPRSRPLLIAAKAAEEQAAAEAAAKAAEEQAAADAAAKAAEEQAAADAAAKAAEEQAAADAAAKAAEEQAAADAAAKAAEEQAAADAAAKAAPQAGGFVIAEPLETDVPANAEGTTPDNNSPPVVVDGPLVPSSNGRVSVQAYNNTNANPNLPPRCGIDIALILDTSGSIGNEDPDGAGPLKSGIQYLRDATDAFLEGVVDTGARVSISSFSTSAVVRQPVVAVTTANLAAIKATYNTIPSNGWTNWDDGFAKAQSTFASFSPSGRPDLVVLISDGNPNTIIGGSGGDAGSLENATNPAITRSNAMKALGSHVFGVAVGSSINLSTIQRVTEQPPTGTALAADASNLRNADWSNGQLRIA